MLCLKLNITSIDIQQTMQPQLKVLSSEICSLFYTVISGMTKSGWQLSDCWLGQNYDTNDLSLPHMPAFLPYLHKKGMVCVRGTFSHHIPPLPTFPALPPRPPAPHPPNLKMALPSLKSTAPHCTRSQHDCARVCVCVCVRMCAGLDLIKAYACACV